MKKFLRLICCLLFAFCLLSTFLPSREKTVNLSSLLLRSSKNTESPTKSQTTATTPEQTVKFALIKDNAIIYSDSGLTSPLFDLPASYFVTVLACDENANDYIKVSYLDIVGYVAPTLIDIVDFVPSNKYPESLSSVVDNDGNGVSVRREPSPDSEKIAVLDSGSFVECYGSISGDTQIDAIGNTWYYVYDKNSQIRGYVYSLFITPPIIPPNDYTVVSAPDFQTTTDFSLPKNSRIVLICALTGILIIAVLPVLKRSKVKS